MTTNINRYSFVDFTAKPYIYHHGIPYHKQLYTPQHSNKQDRTIIRTNQPNQNMVQQYVPTNRMQDIGQNQMFANYDDNWSNLVRKDNMYTRYAANNC
jgi:hypothetical protein